MTENIPPGFKIEKDRLVHEKTKEYFLIRNRSLDEIDHTFRGLIKKIVPAMVDIYGKGNVKILDVGGGQESKASKELANLNVQVFNADLLARPSDKKANFYPLPASVFNLPFENSTFDFIFTRQLLPYFNPTKNDKALNEIARVMKPGAVGLVDEPFYSHPKYYKTDLKKLEGQLSSKISIVDTGMFLDLTDKLQKIVDPEMFPPGKFLVIQKLPIVTLINKVIDKVPQKLPLWKTK